MNEKKSRRRLYEEPSAESDKKSGSKRNVTAKKATTNKTGKPTSTVKANTSKTKKSPTTKKSGAKKASAKVETKASMETNVHEKVITAKAEPQSGNSVIIEEVRLEKVDKLIKKYSKWSAGLVLVPVPVFDLASLVTAQTTMIAEIASIYGVPFHEEMKKSLFSVILSGLFAHSVSHLPWLSLSKMVPGFHLFWNTISYPIAAAGTTYAVGKVFVQHFESGGTLLDFDPKRMKEYFRSMYKDGVKLAKS